jgi:hypothetical protein
MKSTNKGLYLSVPTPCGENWHHMSPKAAGKYCISCNKTVVDFSLLTDAEIFAVIRNSKGSICGHFKEDQLGRCIPEPVAPRSQLLPVVLITAGLTVGLAERGFSEARNLERMEIDATQGVYKSVDIIPDTTLEATVPADTAIAPEAVVQLPELIVPGYAVRRTVTFTGTLCVTTVSGERSYRDYEPMYYSGRRLMNKILRKKKRPSL